MPFEEDQKAGLHHSGADPELGMEVHPDSNFAGAWESAGAGEDVDTARSRHGFIVSYCGVPLFWKSQMQTEIALSSTEAEFIALATATRATIPIQRILMEMKERGFPVVVDKNKIHCSVFENNSGALAIAKLPKTRPRTKHINVKYFHWLSWVHGEGAQAGPFSFHKIATEDQPARMC